jgi:hypothetical protein
MEDFVEVGDRVIMLDTTQYDECSSNPRNIEGTVTYIDHEFCDGSPCATVSWDNDCNNGSYNSTDIGRVNIHYIRVSTDRLDDSEELTEEDRVIIKSYLVENNIEPFFEKVV